VKKHGITGEDKDALIKLWNNRCAICDKPETIIDKDALIKLWNNRCAICDKPETIIDKRSNKIRELALDHDHKLGHIRGVLCSKCNRGIGMFDENIEFLQSAITYLKNYREVLEEQNAAISV
jgi:hypothetical protein